MNQTQGKQEVYFIPGSKWRVNDPNRPLPPVVTPGTFATQEKPADPPSDAIVLFDGSNLEGWEKLDGSPAGWKVENGYMEVVPKSGDIRTKVKFGDCQLHIEWAAPKVIKDGQDRGNSGVFLMERYEIQVLDGYNNITYADGITGAIYGQCPPLVNACRKPAEWQTYDIIWIAPRFDNDKLIQPAYVTVIFNGVLIHYHRKLTGPTTHKRVLPYTPHPPVGALMLQDHGDPVRYRNIWYRRIDGWDIWE